MPNSYYYKILAYVVVFLLLCGCSTGFEEESTFYPQQGHPVNWVNPERKKEADYHTHTLLEETNSALATCKGCHGDDLDGGISMISCSSCHNGPDGLAEHPETWNEPEDAVHYHGYYGLHYTFSCSSCHGKTLSGQIGQSCFNCHEYECAWNTFGAKSSTLCGIAAKGPIMGGVVTAYQLTDNFAKSIGPPLGAAVTDHLDGSFLVNLGDFRGDAIIELDGGQYLDEATGGLVDNECLMRALVLDVVGQRKMVITPLTEVAFLLAQNSMGGFTKENIDMANALISTKLLGEDILLTQPVFEKKSESTTQAQQDYGLLLAALSQMGESFGYSVEEIIYLLFEDLTEDNTLDASSLLLSALSDFLNNPLNTTSIIEVTQTSLDELWAGTAGLNGQVLYTNHCARCHNPDGSDIEGISFEDALNAHNWIHDALSEEEMKTIVEYLSL